MINFYNYLNFFIFNKKIIFNVILCFLRYLKIGGKNLLIFIVILNSTKFDIKNSLEYLFKIKILKINTLILKKIKKKKAFIYFNDFV